MGVKVVKFGGSSVADADQVRKIRAKNHTQQALNRTLTAPDVISSRSSKNQNEMRGTNAVVAVPKYTWLCPS